MKSYIYGILGGAIAVCLILGIMIYSAWRDVSYDIADIYIPNEPNIIFGDTFYYDAGYSTKTHEDSTSGLLEAAERTLEITDDDLGGLTAGMDAVKAEWTDDIVMEGTWEYGQHDEEVIVRYIENRIRAEIREEAK